MAGGSTMLTDRREPDLPEWLRELYPFRTRTLQLGSEVMSFVDEGPDEGSSEAPAFVLLHGNPTWSFLYRDLIPRLRSKYRVVAPDAIGFGLSDKPDSAAYHSLGQHISNFGRLIEALDLQNFSLVVNGWGGPVGLGYAVAHPQNISRLVLVNTWAANLNPRRNKRLPLGMRIAARGRVGQWLDSLLNLSMHSVFSSRTHSPIGDMAFEAYSYPFRQHASRAAIAAFSRMFFEPDRETVAKLAEIEAGLTNIAAPADILWGTSDPVLGKLPVYLLRDGLKNSREPVFVPEVSHYLPEEAPEVLAQTVLRGAEPKCCGKTDTGLFKILS
jgi:pimeloyl-ACP methyl ester carboxylesterase